MVVGWLVPAAVTVDGATDVDDKGATTGTLDFTSGRPLQLMG